MATNTQATSFLIGMTKAVEIGSHKATARELSVLEIRNWLKAQTSGDDRPFDVVDQMLFADHDVTLDDLLLMSDASRELIADAPPSEIEKLVTAVKLVNPSFFQMRQRLNHLGTALAQSSQPNT